MESFNIAVIGAAEVGKSSFIQHVLGLSRPPISDASSVRMVVDSITHMITLIELDLDCFEFGNDQPIRWPKQINGHIVPRVDAALVLYDVTEQESVRRLPQAVGSWSFCRPKMQSRIETDAHRSSPNELRSAFNPGRLQV